MKKLVFFLVCSFLISCGSAGSANINLEQNNAFIKNYTFKQWGIDPKKLPASTFNRLPVRFNYNEDYFNHCNWQGIPENGYTEIFEKLLSSRRIKLFSSHNATISL